MRHPRNWPRRRWTLARIGLAVCAVAVLAAGALRHFPLSGVRVKGVAVEVVALGPVDSQLLTAIAEGAGKTYGVPHHVGAGTLNLPAAAYDAKRKQYDAGRLLSYLSGQPRTPRTHLLAVTEADITSGDMSFLFGLANQPGSVAVMSLHRLRPHQTEGREALLRDRATKIGAHELGHTFGFGHCRDPRCVMSYSNSAAGVDETDTSLCARCASRLR
jgi:archaemetzincin